MTSDVTPNTDAGSLYYTYLDYTQISASQYEFRGGLKKRHLVTGDEVVLYECEVSRYDKGLEISAYTEDTILLSDLSRDWSDGEQLLDFETEQVIEAPSIKSYDGFYVDDNCYYTYSQNGSKNSIYRYAPENGYEQELLFYEEYEWSEDNIKWNSILFVDGAAYVSTYKGIIAYRDGEKYLLVADPYTGLYSIGDGYIYYAYSTWFYRILPDGSGWELVDWYRVGRHTY